MASLYKFLDDSGGSEVRNHAFLFSLSQEPILNRNSLLPTPTMRLYINSIAINYQLKP